MIHKELFFKWTKCILKCRHLLAESPQGVQIQLYCALIAAMMLFALTGRKPTKRDMEIIQFYFCGWATFEATASSSRYEASNECRKRNLC